VSCGGFEAAAKLLFKATTSFYLFFFLSISTASGKRSAVFGGLAGW
jgi:hypothetical protein